MSAILLTGAAPHTPEWHDARADGIGSSEIAAVLGQSPWTSPFDLYWRKINREHGEPNDAQRWGTRLEPVIADAWADTHPEFTVCPTGVWMHPERTYQRASPDRLIFEGHPDHDPAALLECKSDNNRSAWGEPGTDEIPMHYLAQVRWQLDTLGLDVGFVAVTFGGPPVEYVVQAHEPSAVIMREAAESFVRRLAEGGAPPIDWHDATTHRLKKLHPTVADSEVELPGGLVEQRREIDRLIKDAEKERDLIDNQVRRMLGDARAGTVDGLVAVTRSVSDLPEQTITRRAYTRHTLTFRKPKKIKEHAA